MSLQDDQDTDGIPDYLEVPGQTFRGLPVYDWGARPGQTDLFIEIDYMDATNGGTQALNEGVVPSEAALRKVVDAFAAHNIAVHFDVGDLFDQSGDGMPNPARFDLGGGGEVPYASPISIVDVVDSYRPVYQALERQSLFYYMVFGDQYPNAWGQSLLYDPEDPQFAAVYEPASLITLGDVDIAQGGQLNTSSAEEAHLRTNLQSSMIMRQLGHNLGLRHGGGDDVNFKPNYISVMNFLWMEDGMPDIGTPDEATRYYWANRDRQNAPCHVNHPVLYANVAQNLYSAEFEIDYSDGGNASIDENAIDETTGLGTASGIAVDLDCNGVIESGVRADINFDATYSSSGVLSVLVDHDDWAALRFYFHELAVGL